MVHDLSSKLWYAKTIYYTAFHNPRRLGWTGQNIISNKIDTMGSLLRFGISSRP